MGIRREEARVELPMASVRATLFVPERHRAAVVCLPALGTSASYYEPLGAALARAGLAAVTVDQRGHGESEARPSRTVDFGYARLIEDAHAVASFVRNAIPGPLFALGHSLGGHVALLAEGTRPGTFDGVALAACGTPYWRRFPPRYGLQIRLLAGLIPALVAALGYFPGGRVGFGGNEARTLMREWARLAASGRFAVEGLDAEARLRDVRLRTLLVSLEGDFMAPEAAVDHLADKLSGAAITRARLTRRDAEPRALDHMRWVRSPDPVVAALSRWLG